MWALNKQKRQSSRRAGLTPRMANGTSSVLPFPSIAGMRAFSDRGAGMCQPRDVTGWDVRTDYGSWAWREGR